ncbi:hypothetical protein EMIT079MI2_150111 [Bacillus sp. IT-79MI2]
MISLYRSKQILGLYKYFNLSTAKEAEGYLDTIDELFNNKKACP